MWIIDEIRKRFSSRDAQMTESYAGSNAYLEPRVLPNIFDDPELTLDKIPAEWLKYVKAIGPTETGDKIKIEEVPSLCPNCGAPVGVMKSLCPGCGTEKTRLYVDDGSIKPAPKGADSIFATEATWKSTASKDMPDAKVMHGDEVVLNTDSDVDGARGNKVELKRHSSARTIISPTVTMESVCRAGAVLTDNLEIGSGSSIAEIYVPDGGRITIGDRVNIGVIRCGARVSIVINGNGSSIGNIESSEETVVLGGRKKLKNKPAISYLSGEAFNQHISRFILPQTD